MSEPPTKENTLVIVVTYGERQCFVRETIQALNQIGITHILIIDNASPIETSREIRAIAEESTGKVTVIRHDQNRGSAGGMYTGLKASTEMTNIRYIWMLDDDNKPQSDAFDRLLEAYEYLGGNEKYALLSLRETRREYRDAAMHGDRIGIVAGSFLGFDIMKRISRWRREAVKGNVSAGYRFPLLKIGYAPYGGFFFCKSMIATVGMPTEAFFLYSDDHEYSMRWFEHDGAIYLCAQSKIIELEESWNGSKGRRAPFIMSSKTDESKLYYFLRNRFYLECRDYKAGPRYWMNAILYLGFMSAIALMVEKKPVLIAARLKIVFRTFKEGSSGVFLNKRINL